MSIPSAAALRDNACAVSVLLASYNTANYLRTSIDSVLGQTLRDLELIIVDDCSSDESWAIIEDAARRDSRVIARRRDVRGGASAGLNDGLRLATGRYITRQDSDDVSLPTRLAEQAAFLDRNPTFSGVGTVARLLGSNDEDLGACQLPESDREIQAAIQEYMCFVGPTVMARRTSFEQIGLNFDEALSSSEDFDLCLRLAEVGALANLQQPLYLYRQHPSSVSHRQRHKQIYRKALALEKSVRRRFGAGAPRERFANAARDYLRAAVLGHAAERSPFNRDCVAKVQELYPDLLDDLAVVDDIVQTCTPPMSEAAAAHFVDSLFEQVLPQTRRLSALRRRLVADFHIREALLPANRGDVRKIGQHLWPAIRRNPRWLTNRGVLSLVVGQAVSLVRRSSDLPDASGYGQGDRT